MHSRQRFVRGLLLASVVFTLLFAFEFLFEWRRLGMPGVGDMSWADKNNAKLVDILSPMARAYNNILAMLIATIGLAIPLTANMHTPKLIEMFLRDRTNQVMLFLCAFGAANVLFAAHLVGPGFAPTWAYRIAVFGSLLGWAAVIPYFFYVVRFLDPSNIIRRLKDDILGQIDAATVGADPEVCQDVVHERLEQIGTIVLKSIDRSDRSVALEGIWSLKLILDHYRAAKGRMSAAWFKVDRKDFVGLSSEAIDLINEDRIWFEHKVMHQMFHAYQGALPKSADAVAAASDATRVIASQTAEAGDDRALDLMIRYFNNYLREAIKRKDPQAIYDIFYQYRLLGRDASRQRPALLKQIGRHFLFYADMAAHNGLHFIPQLAAFDLGWLVRRAYEDASPAASDLLDDVLAIQHVVSNKPVPLVIKAKIGLGGFFLETNRTDETDRVRGNLADIPVDLLDHLGHDLLQVEERCFWEVTDRQINFEWMAPERRKKTREFLDSCTVEQDLPSDG